MTMKMSDLRELKDMLSDLEVDVEAVRDMACRIYSDGGLYSKAKLIIEKYVNSQFDDTMRNLNLAYTGINNAYDNIDEVIDRLEEGND
ncbi:hypothetical protein [Limosilactobacillus ingluviei]|uniref:hypothetical protein n=1 Tax=Limosilactobacillus ingluviei TaxID=148604 RepID=UPI0023F093E7|nr:hypothetical protein [Limosilactobacillus ingluviei]